MKLTFVKKAGLVAAVLAPSLFINAAATGSYPTRPVRIITGQAPGGPSDTAVRGVAEALSKALGRPFFVDNRPGAEGTIAAEACARAAPDGYTLCVADSHTTFLTPQLRNDLRYSPKQAFAPIMHLGFLASGLWVNSASGFASASELMARAEKSPDSVLLGSWGPASNPHILQRYLAQNQRIVLREIPYKSAGAMWQALLANEVQVGVYSLAAGLNFRPKAGLLAINTDERMAEFPDTPTFKELRLPSVITWFVMNAPRGTADAILDKLNATMRDTVYQDAETRSRVILRSGLLAYGVTGKDRDTLTSYLLSQEKMYDEVIKAARIQTVGN